jgi:hypothetical protein
MADNKHPKDGHKRYQLAKDIHVVKDAEKDPIGTPHKAGKKFSAVGLRRAGIDAETRQHWIGKGVIVDLGGDEDGET